ncbi:MAG: DUF4357 domain-containing protein [Bilifractor sp.]
MSEHKRNPNKDYWTEAEVFTTSNNSFAPMEISYLENRFCNLATHANRYTVKNGNDPTPGNITEEKESEMEEFIDYAKVIMGVLGHKVFEPLPSVEGKTSPAAEDTSATNSVEVDLFLHRNVKGIGVVEANGRQIAEGFVVFKGSDISPVSNDSIAETVREKREKAQRDALGKLAEDAFFTSPSYAAVFVVGKVCNGLTAWKDAKGRTLKELEKYDEE